MSNISVKIFTQGKYIPSTRFRITQLKEHLKAKQIDIEESHARSSAYPPYGRINRVIWIVSELFFRCKSVLFEKKANIYIFQREMVSTLYTFERFVRGPKILDVDDAVWLKRKGRAIDQLAATCDAIVCGNTYLANYFKKFGKKVVVIPTAVDTLRFVPAQKKINVLGWSGGSSAFKYLYAIEDQLAYVLDKNPDWKLRVVADLEPKFKNIQEEQVEFIKWSPEVEVEAISTMAIGLMPLEDEPWSLGKCSYKMLLYMACGLPVVVSEVGMNCELLEKGEIGFGVEPNGDWTGCLNKLICDRVLRERMGKEGRQIVTRDYSTARVIELWGRVIDDVLKRCTSIIS